MINRNKNGQQVGLKKKAYKQVEYYIYFININL